MLVKIFGIFHHHIKHRSPTSVTNIRFTKKIKSLKFSAIFTIIIVGSVGVGISAHALRKGQIYTREDMENTNLISGGQLENPRCVLSDGPDSVFEDPIYDDPPTYRR